MRRWAKQKIRNALRKRGWDLVRGPNLSQFIDSRRIDLVIDVGGNKGDYGHHLRRWGYRGPIVSLEPASGPYALLEKRISRDIAWDAKRIAAGSEPGKADINLSQASVFNSFLPLTSLADGFDPQSGVVGTETVEVDTIDNVFHDHPFERGFLKIDTQGFERQVLEGAVKTLARCQGVQLELPVGHLYSGVWSLREAIAHMEALGFALAQNTPTNTFTHDRASAIEFDCIFRRMDGRD